MTHSDQCLEMKEGWSCNRRCPVRKAAFQMAKIEGGNTIRRCPFCGASASIEEVAEVGERVFFSVGCDSDSEAECMGYQSLTKFNTRKEAVAAWNKRAGVPGG